MTRDVAAVTTPPGSLRAALAALVLDPENDDPVEWTDEQLLARTEALMGEGWHHAGKADERLADARSALRYIEQRYGRLDGVGWERVLDA